MTDLLAIDVGGTSIKFAIWKKQELLDFGSVQTPRTLNNFYQILTDKAARAKEKYPTIKGVAISTPGAVNKKTGVIEGASALPYIHNFKIQDELEQRLGLPVTLENDANCAGLAELRFGAGKGCNSLIFLVIGTGVGGCVIIDQKIWHGAHLFGGEFGFMLTSDGQTLSQAAATISMVKQYNQRTGQELNGKEIFDLAHQGDQIAKEERDKMIHALAVTIYNLQHAFDPEKIIIGGGVSANPELLGLIKAEIEKIRSSVDITTLDPVVDVCQYKNQANLLGAIADFEASR